jgi:hypothetical protein
VGSDPGAGVRAFTLFVSENGGPYTEWLSNTDATSAVFDGRPDTTYAFYSVARDHTGHVEAPPQMADATTTVTLPNGRPIASAGNDRTVTVGTVVTLDGSESRDDGRIMPLAFTWRSNTGFAAAGRVVALSLPLGIHAFTLTVDDGEFTATDDVIIEVVPAPNRAPTATPDYAETLENHPVVIPVLTNDSDSDGGVLTIGAVSSPAHGIATVTAAGRITYVPSAGFFGNDTLTYMVSDGQGGAATAVVTIAVSRLARFVALGTEQLWLRSGSKVLSGDVGANTAIVSARRGDNRTVKDSKVEVRIGRQSALLQPGSRVVGDTVWLQRSSSVFDVLHNELVNRAGVVLGRTARPVLLPFVPLPAFPATRSGTSTIVVARGATRTLVPGAYGRVHVRQQGTLILTGGVYHAATLDLETGATVVIQGRSDLRIQHELATASRARVIVDSSVPGLRASSVLIHVGGDDASGEHDGKDAGADDGAPTSVHIGEQNVVHANVYAPNGTVWLKARTVATGAFIGKRVRVGERVQLTLDSAFR